MTDNAQELNEILTKLENAVALNIGSQGMRGEAPKRSHWKAKQAILDWHNKRKLEAIIDTLEYAKISPKFKIEEKIEQLRLELNKYE